jgi:replicative DNA helicase
VSNLDDLAQVDESKEGAVAQAVDGIMERMTRQRAQADGAIPLDQLREIMGGDMEAGNLYGMLSSSGEGKTSLALQIMDYAASQGHPVAFLSYDQSEEQCIDQIASQRTGIENTRIRNKTMTSARWAPIWTPWPTSRSCRCSFASAAAPWMVRRNWRPMCAASTESASGSSTSPAWWCSTTPAR